MIDFWVGHVVLPFILYLQKVTTCRLLKRPSYTTFEHNSLNVWAQRNASRFETWAAQKGDKLLEFSQSKAASAKDWFLHKKLPPNRWTTYPDKITGYGGKVRPFMHKAGDCAGEAAKFIKQYGGILGKLEKGSYSHYWVHYRGKIFDPTLRDNLQSWSTKWTSKLDIYKKFSKFSESIGEKQAWFTPKNHREVINFINQISETKNSCQ